MQRLRWLAMILLLLAGTLWVGAHAPLHAQGREVLLLTVTGPVTPAMGSYLERGLQEAERTDAALLVLRLDTPGGQVDVMRDLVQLLSNATVPTMVYVWPRGAHAASAGTFVTLSADLAAMAPQTTIGSASVVGGQGEEIEETLKAKITNDLVAAIRSQSERRGPQAADWAERAVTEAIAANNQEALELGLIDFVARDMDELLAQAHGATVELGNGETVTLDLTGAVVRPLEMGLLERLLHLITNPSIALLLVSLGSVALLYELYTPGGYIGGIFGVIALLMGFYALGSLDADWAGLALVLFAFVLFAVEAQASSHGLFAAGGLAAFVFGSMLMFQSSYRPLSLQLLGLMSLLVGGGFTLALSAALRARHRPAVTGAEGLLGSYGVVRTALAPEKAGMVLVQGELWRAYAPMPLEQGSHVRVVALRGLSVEVEPVEPWPHEPGVIQLEQPM